MIFSFALLTFALALGVGAQTPGLGTKSGAFQCFHGWYQELINDNPSIPIGQNWFLGTAYHDENSVCGGYGGSCPSDDATEMSEFDVQSLVVSTQASHYTLTAYEIHDADSSCPIGHFCVMGLSWVYFVTRAYWSLLWRYSGDKLSRLCVRTDYPGYVWVQGYTMSTPNLEIFKSLPTPDVIKLMDRVSALDSTVKGSYVGCFSTAGEIKTDCPILAATHTSGFGLDGTYVRTDYPEWIFLPGMNFTQNNRLPAQTQWKYNIPKLLQACNTTFDVSSRCIMVNTWGNMNDEIGDSQLRFMHDYDKLYPQLGGTWINRAYAEKNLQLGLAPQTKSG